MIGRTGQVGVALAATVPAGVTLIQPGRDGADLAQPGSLAAAVEAAAPDIVINAGAYTAVDRAEADAAAAWALNATGAGALATAAAARGVPVIHISTDYVLAGTGEMPQGEDAPVGPTSVYGASKLAGEYLVAACNPDHVILRTSWVYAPHGANFVRTMLRLGAERDRLTIVADQWGRPTSADEIAGAIWTIAARLRDGGGEAGIYNLSGGGPFTTWHGFAAEIFARAGGASPELVGIPTADYPTPARRPLNSRLDLGRIAGVWGIAARDWRESLGGVLARL